MVYRLSFRWPGIWVSAQLGLEERNGHSSKYSNFPFNFLLPSYLGAYGSAAWKANLRICSVLLLKASFIELLIERQILIHFQGKWNHSWTLYTALETRWRPTIGLWQVGQWGELWLRFLAQIEISIMFSLFLALLFGCLSPLRPAILLYRKDATIFLFRSFM